jgi:hypothetical protein
VQETSIQEAPLVWKEGREEGGAERRGGKMEGRREEQG